MFKFWHDYKKDEINNSIRYAYMRSLSQQQEKNMIPAVKIVSKYQDEKGRCFDTMEALYSMNVFDIFDDYRRKHYLHSITSTYQWEAVIQNHWFRIEKDIKELQKKLNYIPPNL